MEQTTEPDPCGEFRKKLAEALRTWIQAGSGAELSWDEHLLHCQSCRDRLAKERVLDELLALAQDDDAFLSVGVAERVLARLEAQRPLLTGEATLDSLLAIARSPVPPGDLGRRIRSGLVVAREAENLDRLLGRVPAPRPPQDLTRRVLVGLDSERGSLERERELLPFHRLVLAAAAMVVMSLLAWRVFSSGELAESEEVARVEPSTESQSEPVPDELLLALDVLERWDEVNCSDLDALLSSLDVTDAALLTLDGEEEAR